MEAIGGYFSLELPLREEYHKDALRLNTGRNCLEYILLAREYKKVYIPYYTCEVILKPFKKLNIEYSFYHIDENLEVSDSISLNKNEAFLYINYFGLKQKYIEILASRYETQLIVDNTQAFYAKPLMGIDTFYTCRKFFGVSDGAYLYTNKLMEGEFEQDVSYNRMDYLLKRLDLSAEKGFTDFRSVDDSLDNQHIQKMSKLTQRIMQSIDYGAVAEKRKKNFQILHDALRGDNNLEFQLEDDAIPMVYPFLSSFKGLREKLIENKVYVARYWPNVLDWTLKDNLEYLFAYQLQPLPIDQRYNENDMNVIIDLINN